MATHSNDYLCFTLVFVCFWACVYSLVDEDVEVPIIRDCKVTEECEFYKDLITLQKTRICGLELEVVNDELKKQKCGWENDMKPKGK